jgi:enamine deaminase RidA (YjgF/YER057c/UK114 family)
MLSGGLCLILTCQNSQERAQTMKRTAINPWSWSLKFGFNQAELLEGVTRTLVCAGQTAVDGDGAAQHPGDMRAQLTLALDNVETVLQGAGMALTNITRLTIYATDVEAALAHFDVLGMRLGPLGVAPPMALLGVTRLAVPQLMVEIEAMAAA